MTTGSIVSAPLVTVIVPVLVMSALVMALVPVDSSVPEIVSVPPSTVAPERSSVEPDSIDTAPPLLVTFVEISFSVPSLIAAIVPLLVTASVLMSSSALLARIVPPSLVITGVDVVATNVSSPPSVDSSR